VISLAQPYAKLVSDAGLIPIPIISKRTVRQFNPNVWKPIRCNEQMIGTRRVNFVTASDVIHQHHVPGKTVLVSHPLDLASRIFRELQHPLTLDRAFTSSVNVS
jgi:hypothetical protein